MLQMACEVYLYFFYYYYFTLGGAGSSLLCVGFLHLSQTGATLHAGVRASHCEGFSCCGTQAPGLQASVVAVLGSVVVVHGLNSSAACGLFADLCPLHWQMNPYHLYHQGSPYF